MAEAKTRKQRRDEAREARIEAERAADTRAARKRRLAILGGIAAAVAVIAVVLVVATGGGSKKPPAAVQGVANTKAFIGTLKQKGNALGDPKAPVTLVEYVDLQCPICKAYSQQVMPTIVKDYVRTGKVRLEQHVVSILGPASTKAQQFAATTVAQNRLWEFTHLFYENQGEENSGYVTDAFLKKIADATPGLDAAKAVADVGSTAANRVVSTADAAQINSTPTFKIGTTGGALTEIDLTNGPQAIVKALDARLK